MASLSYCPRCLTTFREATDVCPNLSCASAAPADGWGLVLGPGDRIDRHYEIERALAVGGAGLTYLAREVGEDEQPTGPRLAVKVLYSARASGPYLQRLATEAQILQELDHDNIVRCRGFVHRAGHEPYLVTRFEEGGSLGGHVERVGALAPRVAAGVVRQVLLALDTAHQRGVVHRDLKPDNVLLATSVEAQDIPHVRVADFGIAKVAGGLSSRITKVGSFVGTPEYAAPEQFEQVAPTAATDMFAVGGLLVFMLTGRPPVSLTQRADVASSYDEMLGQIPPVLTAEEGGAQVDVINGLLAQMMAVRPEHRCTIQLVLQGLRPLLASSGVTSGTLELTADPAPGRKAKPLPTASTFALSAPPVSAQQDEAPLRTPSVSAQAAPSSPLAEPSAPTPTSASGGRNRVLIVVAALGLSAAGGAGLAVLWGVSQLDVMGVLSDLTGQSAVTADAFDPSTAQPVGPKERQAIQSALQAQVGTVGQACGATGGVIATVVLDPTGVVRFFEVDPGWVHRGVADCVGLKLDAVNGPAGDAPRLARVALDLSP
jgi:serine/threonine protein kinase